MNNSVTLKSGKILSILPTKLKYFKDNSYSGLFAIKKFGAGNLLVKFSDGLGLIENFLKAVFDVEEIDFLDEVDASIIEEIISVSLKVNDIKLEDETGQKKVKG